MEGILRKDRPVRERKGNEDKEKGKKIQLRMDKKEKKDNLGGESAECVTEDRGKEVRFESVKNEELRKEMKVFKEELKKDIMTLSKEIRKNRKSRIELEKEAKKKERMWEIR